jgi:fructose-specific phosphotransferase system IIC component
MRSSLKEIFEKRKESIFANAGFKAGIISGILSATYIFFTIFILKDRVLNHLLQMKDAFKFELDVSLIYYISLIVGPPMMILIYTITGLFLGILIKKLKKPIETKVVLIGLGMGIIFGCITKTPVNKLLTIGMSVISWLVYSVTFIIFLRGQLNKGINRVNF